MKTAEDWDAILNELYWNVEHGEHKVAVKKLQQWERDAAIYALNYTLQLVNGRHILNRHAAYLAAVDEMEIFLMAAIERVANGEPIHSEAIVQ